MVKKPILEKFVNTANFLYLSNFQLLKIKKMISNFGKGPFLGWHREKGTIDVFANGDQSNQSGAGPRRRFGCARLKHQR
jgi:hypothetical protein